MEELRGTNMGYRYIFLTITFTVYGQLILKQQVNTLTSTPAGIDLIPFYFKFIITRPLVLSGFFSAVLASLAWIAAISRFELSYAYPFMSLNFVVVVILSLLLFGETMNPFKISGLFLICVGVLILSKGLQH
jgi:multidrug transporter EmrE-like cation transporter